MHAFGKLGASKEIKDGKEVGYVIYYGVLTTVRMWL